MQTVSAQKFYVNTGKVGLQPEPGKTYLLDIDTCNVISDTTNYTIYSCVPTSIDSVYNDIAIDKQGNIWYVTEGGHLYKRKLNDTTSCQFLGDFTTKQIAGLVADTAGNIYAAGNFTDTCTLYKYDSTGFHVLGYLPRGVYCAGDLFFYKYRLFMTSYYKTLDTGFITEIVIPAPEQSCYYMGLGTLIPFGAFCINDNNATRTFITPAIKPNYDSSLLVEIDMDNRKILKTLCTYPFSIRGAATYYNLTGDSTQCPYTPNSVTTLKSYRETKYVDAYNPVKDIIRVNTNLDNTEIRTINLYDLSGKKIKSFGNTEFPGNLNIADLSNGLYIFQIISSHGEVWNQKVVKSDF
ncbi:MAG: T9SS type A sorting domain-containing protein [Chitinophagales bacterium]|nr:T9SS type A sorting domain-containing protein [Chitinophagales bacterium]